MRTLKCFLAASGLGFVLTLSAAPGLFFWFSWQSALLLMGWLIASAKLSATFGLSSLAATALGLLIASSASGLAFGTYATIDDYRIRRFR